MGCGQWWTSSCLTGLRWYSGEVYHNVQLKLKIPQTESLIVESRTGVLCLGGVNTGCIVVRGGLCYTDIPGYKCAPPNLLVDTLKFDAEGLTKLGSDSCEVLEIQSDRSFNFALNSTPSVQMTVIGCFPLKGMNASTKLDASKDYIWEKIKDGLQWVDIANSHIKGATRNGFFRRIWQNLTEL